MKTVDITPIKEIDIQYEKSIANLNEKYKGEWDDAVHESYGRYVSQLQDLSREVRDIRCKVETLEKEAEALQIEELTRKAEMLCKEADAV